MKQITAIIVDDEERSSNSLLRLLEKNHPEVELLGVANDLTSGLDLVERRNPQLLFLDIELKDRTGFELIEALGERKPHVVFTTAHVGYAIKAIRFSALDYLLKPIAPYDLAEAVKRAREAVDAPLSNDRYEALLKNLDRSTKDRAIALPVKDGLEMVQVNEIVHCESDSNYTTVHLRNGTSM